MTIVHFGRKFLIEMWKNLPQVAICATMSAGKSTLINALLGKNFVASSNYACTAKITSLLNFPTGENFIGGYPTDNGKIIETVVTANDLKLWNADAKIKKIYLVGGLQNIECPLVIHDTPGTNNSISAEHAFITEKFFQNYSVDLIIFIINAQNNNTNDEAQMLKFLKATLADSEIIFVINKIDALDFERENIQDFIDCNRQYLINFGFESPKIFPISAEAALLFRMLTTQQNFTEHEKLRLKILYDYLLDENFQLPTNLNFALDTNADTIIFDKQSYNLSDLQKAIYKTGICDLEEFINKKFWRSVK